MYRKMKVNSTYIYIGVIIFITILISTGYSSMNFVPHNPSTIFAKQFPYSEGFNSEHDSLDYINNKDNTSDKMKSFLSNGDTSECKKVYGFDGLFCKPFVADKKIDVFSEAEGKKTCFGSSSGLSNSQGSLCLTESQKALLSTRGGNQAGDQHQIGK